MSDIHSHSEDHSVYSRVGMVLLAVFAAIVVIGVMNYLA